MCEKDKNKTKKRPGYAHFKKKNVGSCTFSCVTRSILLALFIGNFMEHFLTLNCMEKAKDTAANEARTYNS